MTDQNACGRSFEVGYGKPPQHTRFVKGKSGNPKGRGKGVRNFTTEIQAELNARIPITENGRRKTITKRKAVAKQLVNKAASGDPRAIPVLLNQTRLQEESSATSQGSEVLSRSEDQLVMANIIKRIRDAQIAPHEQPAQAGPDHQSANTSQSQAARTSHDA